MSEPTDEELRTAAVRLHYDEGDVEIDPDAAVSRARHERPSGAYVQAWIWVAYDDVTDEDRANAAPEAFNQHVGLITDNDGNEV